MPNVDNAGLVDSYPNPMPYRTVPEIEDGPSRGGRRLGPSGFSPGGSG